MHIRLQLVILLLLCVCSVASTAYGIQSAAQVELKDGTVYRNVSFVIDRKHRTLELRLSYETPRISFDDILVIRDAEWNDITLLMLGKNYVQKPQKVMLKQKLPFSFAFSGGLGYAFMVNAGRKDSTTELAVNTDLAMPISRHFALRLSVSSTYGVFTTTRYFFSLMFYNWKGQPRRKSGYFYTFVGLGSLTQKLNGPRYSAFASTQCVGFVLMLSKNTGLDLSFKHDLIFVESLRRNYKGGFEFGRALSIFDLRVNIVSLAL